MALAAVVDTLESVPEAVRGAYVPKDGKFHLDFEIEDVAGLKNTVTATRAERDALDAQLKAWKKSGKSPDEIAEMVEAARVKEEQAEIKAGNFDKVLAKKLGDQKLESDSAIAAATKQRDSALGIARKAVVDTRIGAALVKAKATASGMSLLPEVLGRRVKLDFDDNGNSTESILAADGTPMIGSLPNGLANYDDLVKEMSKSHSDLFEGVGGGGGTPPKGGGGSGAKTLTLAEFHALGPTERAEKMKAGFKVVD